MTAPVLFALGAPASLVKLFEPWSSLYSDSKLVATIVVCVHVGALLGAGGMAIAMDRATLRAATADARTRQLDELADIHRWVLSGLALSAVSGLLLFASDVETYWVSKVFWTKMAMIVVLLVNGWRMTRAEAALRLAPTEADAEWKQMRVVAIVSTVFWFLIAFAGVALVNAA